MNNIYKIFTNISRKNNSVIIFDIDETLINNNGEKIDEIINFFNYIKYNNFIPIIITARPNNNKSILYTENQLKKFNITGYKYIYFMPKGYNVENYKKIARKDIIQKGYKIEMSIGDKYWDIGKYSNLGVLVKSEKNKIKIKIFYIKPKNNNKTLKDDTQFTNIKDT